MVLCDFGVMGTRILGSPEMVVGLKLNLVQGPCRP